jgi:hypothetical protein
VDLGVASELDLVILDPEWSGSGRTRAPGAPVLYPNRKGSIPKSEGGQRRKDKMC